ncbi:hypothetical protein [Dielma fastidiosa]|uniref:hypothetical protein n=1 Tax=Dielma fastidiosa TaxID=1034346 RepID=UPI0035687B34
MEYFKDLSKDGKFERLTQVMNMIDVPDDFNYLYAYYKDQDQNELFLYDMREMLLCEWRWVNLPAEVKFLLL